MSGGGAQMSVRRAIVTALLATGVVGGTSAAAQMFDGRADEPILEETPTTTPDSTTTTTAPLGEGDEEGEDGEGEAPDADEGSVERWYEGCGHFTEGTHGDYVRDAAQAEDATGESVSEAAKSPCGKPLSSVHTEAPEEPVIEPAPEDTETSVQSHGQGQGQGQGRGQGQGGGSPGKSGSSQGRGPKR